MLKAAIGGLILLGVILAGCTQPPSDKAINDKAAVDTLEMRMPVADKGDALRRLRQICTIREAAGTDAGYAEAQRQFAVTDPALIGWIVGASGETCK